MIDYENWTPPTYCNIFKYLPQPPAQNATTEIEVNGLKHLTTVGKPEYGGGAVYLRSTLDAVSQVVGTEYRITYSFQQRYNYKIKVNAKKLNVGTVSGAPINLRLNINSNGSYHEDGCNNPSFTNLYPSNGLKQSKSITNTSDYVDYEFDFVSLQQADNYVMVAAILPANTSNEQYIYIKKITITETAPPAAFTVSSSISSLACGATTPVTFTANNVNNIPSSSITNYNWNLGAVPNGWLLPGGAPAPATYSTGTTNNLTLTPDCGKALASVSATITANATNYNTSNSATISLSQPGYSISGNSSLCSGGTPYTINGAVCNSSVLWTAPDPAYGSFSSLTASPTTLTYGGTNGNITLNASVTSCGVATAVSLPIHVGANTTSDYTLSGNNGSNYWCPNQTLTFSLNGAAASNYSWSVPSGWTIQYNGGPYIQVKTPTSPYPPTGTLSVSFTEPCGSVLQMNQFMAYQSSVCSPTFHYTLSPNPASNYLNIACTSLQTYCNIAAVQITDIYGTVKSSQTWSYTNQQVQMPVYSLTNGTYVCEVYDGSQWYSQQFQVQH